MFRASMQSARPANPCGRSLWLGLFAGLAIALTASAIQAQQPQNPNDPAPPAPTNLIVSDVPSGLQLTWTAPDTTGIPPEQLPGTLDSYIVQRRIGPDSAPWLDRQYGVAQTAFLDDQGAAEDFGRFAPDRRYSYRVLAVYTKLNEQQTELLSTNSVPTDAVSTYGPAYPSTSGMTRTDSASGTTLTWTAPSPSWKANSASLLGYELRVTEAGPNGTDALVGLSSDTTSYTYQEGDWTTAYRITAVYGNGATGAELFVSGTVDFPAGTAPPNTNAGGGG